jgi:hypothetical protein
MFRLCKIIALSLIACLSAGCQQTAEEAFEGAVESQLSQDGSQADVDIDRESMSMKVMGKKGPIQLHVGAGTKVPKDFPSDVPLYPGMTVMMSHSQAEGQMFFVQAKSSDPVAKIAGFYEKQAPTKGWQSKNSTTAGDITSLGYAKDGRTLQITFSAVDGEGTGISIATGSD